MPSQILFLCTGNYYRSRFAEILFNHLAERDALPWRADSRGLAIEFGLFNSGPMFSDAALALIDRGIHPPAMMRHPLPVQREDLVNSQLVVALKEAEHRVLLRERWPGWEERVEYWHIDDVDCGEVPDTLAAIERAIVELIGRLHRT